MEFQTIEIRWVYFVSFSTVSKYIYIPYRAAVASLLPRKCMLLLDTHKNWLAEIKLWSGRHRCACVRHHDQHCLEQRRQLGRLAGAKKPSSIKGSDTHSKQLRNQNENLLLVGHLFPIHGLCRAKNSIVAKNSRRTAGIGHIQFLILLRKHSLWMGPLYNGTKTTFPTNFYLHTKPIVSPFPAIFWIFQAFRIHCILTNFPGVTATPARPASWPTIGKIVEPTFSIAEIVTAVVTCFRFRIGNRLLKKQEKMKRNCCQISPYVFQNADHVQHWNYIYHDPKEYFIKNLLTWDDETKNSLFVCWNKNPSIQKLTDFIYNNS